MLFELDELGAPTLDNFVVEGNEEIIDTMRRLAGGAQGRSAVVVWGPEGSGKSHLLAATAQAARTSGQVVDDSGRLERPEDCDLAVADDADKFGEDILMQLFRTLDLNRRSGRPAVLAACETAPATLVMREDVRTRLAQCLTIGVHRLSDDAKRRALASYSKRLGRNLPDDIAEYLILREPRDLGLLLAALRSLDRYALLHRKALSLRTVREWNEHRLEQEKRGSPA